jgi:hypothetical protein
VPAFRGPVHAYLDPEVAAALDAAETRVREVRYTRSTPLCRGQASADWLNCGRGRRACRPPAWTPHPAWSRRPG